MLSRTDRESAGIVPVVGLQPFSGVKDLEDVCIRLSTDRKAVFTLRTTSDDIGRSPDDIMRVVRCRTMSCAL